MKFWLSVIVTIILAWVIGLFLPWWSIAVAAFVVALIIPQKESRAWLSGFLSVFIFWTIAAAIINFRNDGILGPKIANILPLNSSVPLLIIVSAIVGGLVGGMSALSGALLVKPAKSK